MKYFLEISYVKINKKYVNILCDYPKEVFKIFTPFSNKIN